MRVRRVHEDEWTRYRDMRLRSLREDPQAFGSSLTEEDHRPEAWWRQRVAAPGITVLLAEDAAGTWVGTCVVHARGPAADLWAMWVDPTARGQGIGLALLRAAETAAREAGASAIELWVNIEQATARRLYERAGYTARGPAEAGTKYPERTFLPMEKRLTRA